MGSCQTTQPSSDPRMPPPVDIPRQETEDIGTYDNPVRFLNQDYRELHREYIQHRARFLDDTFPPNESSIGEGLLPDHLIDKVEWIRPTKLVQDPYLIVGEESRFDFAQGELGNCWFLAAVGAITFRNHIMEQVVPSGQSFSRDYAGIFHFRFWRFGKWVDVVIDDKLPIVDGRLLFVHCKTRNEFWPALLEKAYAKVCGSYADLKGGFISEALCDFTGGVFMTLRLKSDRPEHWGLMKRANECKALMGCASKPGATSANTELPNGIVQGHAYTITHVTKVMCNDKPVKLVRLLNPWGHKEWLGDWSDRSPLWRTVNDECRDLLDNKDDGEFWMSMEDFYQNFANVDICCESPAFLDGSSPNTWSTVRYKGKWDRSMSGGATDNQHILWMNLQYPVKIPALEGAGAESLGLNLLVSLLQKPNSRHRKQLENIDIGFSVYTVPSELKDQKVLPASFFATISPVAECQIQNNTRELVEFFRLRPGRYIIVPFSFRHIDNVSFLLTIHSKTQL